MINSLYVMYLVWNFLFSHSIGENNYCINSSEQISNIFAGHWVNRSYAHQSYIHKNGSIDSWVNASCPADMLRYSCYLYEDQILDIRNSAHMKEKRYFQFEDCTMKEFDPFILLETLRHRKLVYCCDSIAMITFITSVCSLHPHIKNVDYHLGWGKSIREPICLVPKNTSGFEDGKHCTLFTSSVYYPDYNASIHYVGTHREPLSYGRPKLLEDIYHHFHMNKYDILLLNTGLHYNTKSSYESVLYSIAQAYKKRDISTIPTLLWRENTPQHFYPNNSTFLNGYYHTFGEADSHPCVAHNNSNNAYISDYRNRLLDHFIKPLHIPILRVQYALASEYQYHCLSGIYGSYDCTHYCLSSGILHFIREIEYNALINLKLNPYP